MAAKSQARIVAAYGGIFVAGSITWGMVADGHRPDRNDVNGALVSLADVAAIRSAQPLTCSSPATPRAGPSSTPRG